MWSITISSILPITSHAQLICRNAIHPLTAGAAYIRVFIFYYYIKYHILNMLKIKCDINKQELTSILSNLNDFHSLEVVDRVSETQLRVGENSNWIIRPLKG